MDSGLLFIDKKAGVTSRYLDNQAQRLFRTRKVGHLGTLDPFATGLLILALNGATKYLPYLPDEEKTYVACLMLGKKTSTGDLTGEVIEEKEVPAFNEKDIEAVLRSFLGESEQLPPMTSAIKKDGVALYKLAHKGQEVEREKRKIFIHGIALLSYHGNVIEFEATVSKGTYIRSLGEDIASRLNTVGHLIGLRRTKVGKLDVSMAKPFEEISALDLKEPHLYVPYPKVELNEKEAAQARNGVKLCLETKEKRILLVSGNKPIAIYERVEDGFYRCLRGL